MAPPPAIRSLSQQAAKPTVHLPPVPTHDVEIVQQGHDIPAVSTWQGARPLRRGPEVNRIGVTRPRPWGLREDVPTHNSAAIVEQLDSLQLAASPANPSTGNWHTAQLGNVGAPRDEPDRLQDWVHTVEPVPPPDAATMPATHTPDSLLPDRPDSKRKTPDPVTLYYSDDEHAVPPLFPDQSSKPPTLSFVTAAPIASADATKSASRASPTVTAHASPRPARAHGDLQNEFDQGSVGRSIVGADRYSDGRRRDKWWKKPPHPAYSPQFADRRLRVTVPDGRRETDAVTKGFVVFKASFQ
ncbi:hypothetical protein Q5752_002490 [Cryptotrichosporon argae]